jgi:L-asparaginase
MSRIAVIGTGGTISSIGRDGYDLVNYVSTGKKYDAAGLVEWHSEVKQIADVVPIPFRAVSSTAMGPAEWLDLVPKPHRKD